MALQNSALRDSVPVMTQVFKNAMIFERYVKIWSDSLRYVNAELNNNAVKKKEAMSNLEWEQRNYNTLDGEYLEKTKAMKKRIRKSWLTILVVLVTTTIYVLVGLLAPGDNIIKMLFLLTAEFAPLALLIILGININVIVKNKKELKKYGRANQKHAVIVSSNNITSLNSFLSKKEKEKQLMLSKKASITQQLHAAQQTLNRIYAQGLIPKRYQGLVQTATIYGYLETGRCNIICGHGGVYDTYEKDLQAGLIIGNLVEINKKMDIVIHNQERLYDEMESINSTVGGIKREIETSNQTLNQIERNSAIAAAAATQSAAAQSYIAAEVWRRS